MSEYAWATKDIVAVFVATSLLHTGLQLLVADVGRALRDPRVVVGALVGNFVLVPLAAMYIAQAFNLSDDLRLGLLLVAMSAGAPFVPALVKLSRGSAPLGVAVMALLLITTVVYLPLVLPHFAPGVSVEPWTIAKPVVFLMLTPLAAGMVLRWRWPAVPARLGPSLEWTSRFALVVLLILLLVLDFDRVKNLLGSGALAATVTLVVVSIVIGFATGLTSSARRRVLALATGQRGISAALLIATHVAQDPDTALMVVMYVLIGELTLFAAAATFGRWSIRAEKSVRR